MTEIENNSYSKHFLINKCNSSQKFKILPYYNKSNKHLFLNKNLKENFSFNFNTPKNSKIKKTIFFPNINNITTISNPFRIKKHKSLKKIKLKILNEKFNNSIDNNNNKFNFKTEEFLNKEKKLINKSKISKKIILKNKINNKKKIKSLSPLNTNSKSELNKIILQIHFNQNNKQIQSTINDLSKQRKKLNNFYQNIKNLLNKDYEKYYNIQKLEDLI
jgi:hypothetical protein